MLADADDDSEIWYGFSKMALIMMMMLITLTWWLMVALECIHVTLRLSAADAAE